MKKYFLIILVCLLFFTPGSTQAISTDEKVINEQIELFVDVYSTLEETWQNAKIKKGESIYGSNDQEVGYIYRLFSKENVQRGYILYLNEKGIVEATFDGTDNVSEIKGKVYYIMPGRFLSKKAFVEYTANYSEDEQNPYSDVGVDYGATGERYDGDPLDPANINTTIVSYTVSSSHMPDLSSNVDYSSSLYHASWIIDGVPDYMNWPDADFNNACAPVSAANLVAYYDNEYKDSFSNQEGWFDKFNMNHDGDADDLINELGDYMGNCVAFDIWGNQVTLPPANCHGANDEQVGAAINDYFDDRGLGEWELYHDFFSSNFEEYKSIIRLGNPTLIGLWGHATYGTHLTTGVGYYVVNGAPAGVVIHDNWQNTGENIWLAASEADVFFFIYD